MLPALVLASLSLSGCELVMTSKGNASQKTSKDPQLVAAAPALGAITAALQNSISSYDSACRAHATAVQQAYETQIDGKNLSGAQVMAIIRGVPDPTGQCLDELLTLAQSVGSNVASSHAREESRSIFAQLSSLIVPEASASGSTASLRMARILRVAYTVYVADTLGLGSAAAKAGFVMSANAIERDLGIDAATSNGGGIGY
jgi:hypothetical protein